MRMDYYYKTKKEYAWAHWSIIEENNFNNDEKISKSKNKVPHNWERRGEFKKRLAPCHKGMGPKVNFGIKNFQGELSLNTSIFVCFKLQCKLEWANYNIHNLVESVQRCITLSAYLSSPFNCAHLFVNFFCKGQKFHQFGNQSSG